MKMGTQRDRADGAREFLRCALEAEEELDRTRERVAELSARCRKVTADWSGLPGGQGEGPERLWAKLADESARAGELERTVRARRRRVARAIGRVSDPAGREVLQLRYLQGLSWTVIRARMARSERTVFRLHSRAAAEAGRAAGIR